MDVNQATVWWIACGALVAVELATGTFYLLMLALGCAAGALAAHLGLSGAPQLLTASLLGGAAVIVLHRLRDKNVKPRPAASNPDVNLDIGQAVQVEQWASDGSASIKYRGAAWQARYIGSGQPQAGRYLIRAVEGSCLLLDH